MSKTYYLDARGDDRSEGTSPKRAWRTLERLSGVALGPGDQIVLAEGQEFPGHLTLPVAGAGTPKNPIVIRGSGARRATIVASGTPAIEVRGGGIEIRDLILKSATPLPDRIDETKVKPVNGLSFYTEDAAGTKWKHVRVERVEASGFTGDGVSVGSGHDSQPGFENTIFRDVHAHDNGGKGICFFAQRDRDKPDAIYPHRNVRIVDCTVSRNRSGSGLVLSGVRDSVVEYSLASGNDGAGGGVGMWAYDSLRVRFRSCIAESTRTRGKDGGGFDLDGGCIECVIEDCLAYHNDGPGFMHCDYPTAGLTRGNVIRRSISVNDGRKSDEAAFGFGFVGWGSGLDDCRLERNLVVVTESHSGKTPEGALFVGQLKGYGGKNDDMHLKGCVATGNFVLVTGKGVPMLTSNLDKPSREQVRFDGNRYDARGVPFRIVEGGNTYESLAAWRSATGQEPRPGPAPSSLSAPTDYRLTNPRALKLSRLFRSYRPR